MKIALCLSGQPRYLEKGYDNIYNNILKKHKTDVFVHTWWENSLVGEKFSFSPHGSDRNGIWLENSIDYIVKKYNPIKIKVENQKNFDTSVYNEADFGKSSPFNNMSMHYSINQSNLLKMEYERDENFKYDVVIRCRFDILFEKFNFDITDLNMDYINLCSAGYQDFYLKRNVNLLKDIFKNKKMIIFNDQFAVSNSENMDYYSDLYNKTEEYWVKFGASPMGERGLTFHLNMSDIIVNIIDNNKFFNNIIK